MKKYTLPTLMQRTESPELEFKKKKCCKKFKKKGVNCKKCPML